TGVASRRPTDVSGRVSRPVEVFAPLCLALALGRALGDLRVTVRSARRRRLPVRGLRSRSRRGRGLLVRLRVERQAAANLYPQVRCLALDRRPFTGDAVTLQLFPLIRER